MAFAPRDWFGDGRASAGPAVTEEPWARPNDKDNDMDRDMVKFQDDVEDADYREAQLAAPQQSSATRMSASPDIPEPSMRLQGLSSSALPQAVTRAMLDEEVAPTSKDRPTQRVHKRSRKGKAAGGYGSD